eukprot:2037158-Amphidinium_carterae.1
MGTTLTVGLGSTGSFAGRIQFYSHVVLEEQELKERSVLNGSKDGHLWNVSFVCPNSHRLTSEEGSTESDEVSKFNC